MSGGSDQQPVPGKETQDSQSKTKTNSKTAATTTPTLPDWMTQGLQQNFQNTLGSVDQFGNRIEDYQPAPFSSDQLAGFQSQRDAVNSQNFQTPLDQLLATARGDYLYGGQGFNEAVAAAQRQVMPQVLSRFGLANRDGGLGATALAGAITDPFAAQYSQERARQLNASEILPGMSLLPGQTLQGIGQQYQALAQRGIDVPLSLYPTLFAAQHDITGQAAPFLGQQQTGTSKGTSSMTGSTSGTSTPSYFPADPTAGLLGGIASGAGIGGQFGGPWGALAGGLGGGLLSFS